MSRRLTGKPDWNQIVSLRGRIQIAAIAALVLWVYWDQVWRMAAIWRSDVDWSHGFLILPFSLYLVNSRREELARTSARPSYWGVLPIAAGMVGYALCVRARIGYPQPLSIIPVIAGAVVMVGGWGVLWRTLFPIGFLALGIPPPAEYYRRITQPLQNLAAAAAEPLLRLLPGVQIERYGINILPYSSDGRPLKPITVAGACSGMNSLLAFSAIALAMAYFGRRPMWQRVVMVLAAAPVALICNVVRVIVTGTLMIRGLDQWATGTPHMLLGLMTFGLGMLLYFLILWVMDHLFVDERQAVLTKETGATG